VKVADAVVIASHLGASLVLPAIRGNVGVTRYVNLLLYFHYNFELINLIFFYICRGEFMSHKMESLTFL
jgi:hypothetical protein